MRKITAMHTLGCILLLFFCLPEEKAVGQIKANAVSEPSNGTFQLEDGDRVVFLGNSLFENDLQFGYLEMALTTRWPQSDVTYRNIGWTGDTVFGDARSYVSSPSGYDLLIEQLTQARPTIVFIAYGSVEAFEGEAGLPRFTAGLNDLLDKVDQLGARAILLSPIPIMSAESAEYSSSGNAMRQIYASAIAQTASDRGKQFIDVFSPLLQRDKNVKLSDNGFHLNESGYYYLATIIEKALGLSVRNESVLIAVSKDGVEAAVSANILDPGNHNGDIKFTIGEAYLPLPVPQHGGEKVADLIFLRITGLRKGFYSLTNANTEVITASADQWKDGVAIKRGALFNQARQLRDKIVKKNELFFYQYRPLNRTYIIGFRSHEQGRHAKGLEDLSIIIEWLEGEIALERMPRSNIYELTRVQ